MLLTINHTTHYAYDQPQAGALQQARLTPRDSALQKVLDWKLEVENGEVQVTFDDQYRNITTLISTEPGANEIIVTAKGQVETVDANGVFGKSKGPAPLWFHLRATPRTEAGKGVRRLSKIVKPDGDLLQSLHDLSAAILSDVPYRTGETEHDTTAEMAIEHGYGVCQDHAQIFAAAARHAGVPVRYVSGYLMMNDRVDQEASHAWAEAWIEGLGWTGFDISNGIAPDGRYVRLACGLDSRDSGPIRGIRHGIGNEHMIVSLQVQQ